MKILEPIAAIAALIFAAPAMQAQIVWTTTTGQPYTGTDADIDTSGSFVAAVTENYSNKSETVGDSVFDVVADSHITGIGNGGSDGSGVNPATATAYQEVLNGCSYTYTGNPPITFTLAGLTTGDVYQVEIWDVANDSTRETEFSSTGSDGTTSVDVENGFIIGTFTAGASDSQAITFQGVVAGGVGEVNAVELRDLGAPEPSTYAMLFAGVGALAVVARLRRLA
jgi:hypothetical protein